MIGRKILHYEIRGHLGGGGGGEVYLARDTRLDRDVAIKRLVNERRLDPDRVDREARLLATLNHPNIVTIFAVESYDGEQFLIMELVEGTPLSRLIKADGLPAETVLHWGCQLAHAVAAAHDAGVLHRDLKPENVLVADEGHLKILDFGLAEAGDDLVEDEEETISRIASITGTVSYLAPELILGHKATTSTDIFAVGVVLYELATGRRPFQAETSVELLADIVNEPIPQVRRLVPGFPKSLGRLIERCLSKVPEGRPDSARELVIKLERLKERAGGGAGRLKSGVALVSLAAMAFVGWWLGTDLGRRHQGSQGGAEAVLAPVEERQRIAVFPFNHLGPAESEFFALGLTEELVGKLAAVADLKVLSANRAQHSADGQVLEPQELGRKLRADFWLEGSVQWAPDAPDAKKVRVSARLVRTEDGGVEWSGRYDRVLEDILSVQAEIAESVIDQLDVALFPKEELALRYRPTEDVAAYQDYLQAIDYRHRPISQDLQRPIRLLEEAVRRDEGFALAWAELAQAHAKLHHFGFDRSPERRQKARQAIEKALELTPTSPEVLLANGYVLYWAERDYDAALQELEAAAVGLPNHPRLAAAQALILRRLGRFEESLLKHGQALDLDPLSDVHDRTMAVSLYFLGRYDEAREHLMKAVELDPADSFNRLLMVQLAWLEGDLKEAREIIESLKLAAGDRALEPPVLALVLDQLVYEGRAEEAYRRLAGSKVEVFSWTVRLYPKELVLAQLAHSAGLAEDEMRNAERALAWIEQALVENPEDARLYGARGMALASLGRAEEAVASVDRGIELLPIEKDALYAPARLLEAARVEARLGRHAASVGRLRELFEVPREYSLAWLQLDPWFRDVLAFEEGRALVAELRDED